ncbi:hypothetical protein AK812_SmicGene29709 [Symbiodinium microadriaticum]|uniref:RRM domain-containing protein n=1 Tax=Symbiodinium microadriaticum TaxID=2951 RepID=A0A1Q9D144_SYMMI|nr:hypothetical protein AK812_SmicGene29709 [Symbiodinium microadriaticum]
MLRGAVDAHYLVTSRRGGGNGNSWGVYNHTLKWNQGKGNGKGWKKPLDPRRTIWVGNLPVGSTGAIGFKTSEEAEEAVGVLNGTVFKKVQIATDAWDARRK